MFPAVHLVEGEMKIQPEDIEDRIIALKDFDRM